MTLSFRGVALAGCALCIFAALFWTITPHLALGLWEVEPGPTTDIIARRYAAILCAMATILYAARNAERSTARQAISLGGGIACLTLSVISISDWLDAEVGLGMLVIIAIESALATCFIVLWHADGAALANMNERQAALSRND